MNNKFNLFDSVIIKKNKRNGTIIDIYELPNRKVYYIVEVANAFNDPDAYGDQFQLYDCLAEELIKKEP